MDGGTFWANIIYVSIGALIGFGGTAILEIIRYVRDKREQHRKNQNILKGIEKEIEEGISRFENFIKL